MFTYFERSWLKSDEAIRQQRQVRYWLELHGWADYVNAFHSQAVHDLETVRSLTQDDLKGLGLTKIGDRRKFLSQVEEDIDSFGHSKRLSAPHKSAMTTLPLTKTQSTSHKATVQPNVPTSTKASRGSAPVKNCGMCDDEPASVRCVQCEEDFCAQCDTEMHSAVGFRTHNRTSISPRDVQPKLGQNVGMVRVLAQRAAEDTKLEILRALGADDDHVMLMTPRVSALATSTPRTELPDPLGPLPPLTLPSRSGPRADLPRDTPTHTQTLSLPPLRGAMPAQSLAPLCEESPMLRQQPPVAATTPTLAPAPLVVASAAPSELTTPVAASIPAPTAATAPPAPAVLTAPGAMAEDAEDTLGSLDSSMLTPVKSPRPTAPATDTPLLTPAPLGKAHTLTSPFAALTPFASSLLSPVRVKPGATLGNSPMQGTPLMTCVRATRGGIGFSPLRKPHLLSPGAPLTTPPRKGVMGSPLALASPSLSLNGSREMLMTREAQELITKAKVEAVAASHMAEQAGVDVARARARREEEEREVREAADEYERKRAIAQVAARRAKEDEDAQSRAAAAEKEAAEALCRLQREQAEERSAAEEEKKALRRAEAALAKQYQATTLARQAVQVEQVVAKRARPVSVEQVVVRVQAWAWDAGRRRGEIVEARIGQGLGARTVEMGTRPLVCVEVPLQEVLELGREERRLLAIAEAEEEEEEEVKPQKKVMLRAVTTRKGASTAPAKAALKLKAASPRSPQPPPPLTSLQRQTAARAQALIAAARAMERSFVNAHGPCFDFGTHTGDLSALLRDVPPLSCSLSASSAQSEPSTPAVSTPSSVSSVSSAFSSGGLVLPSLTRRVTVPRAGTNSARSPTAGAAGGFSSAVHATEAAAGVSLSALRGLLWVHPVTGQTLTSLGAVTALLPTPAQQLHHMRNRPEVFGGPDQFSDHDRHPGSAGNPLVYPYRFDVADCWRLFQDLEMDKDTSASPRRYSCQALRTREEATQRERWRAGVLVIPIDVVLAPQTPLTLPSSAPAPTPTRAFRFLWSEHCYKDERDRLLRTCAGCQRYFSDDVNHGSACRRHAERAVDVLVDARQSSAAAGAPPTLARRTSLCAALEREDWLVHPCCGAAPVKLAPPPQLVPEVVEPLGKTFDFSSKAEEVPAEGYGSGGALSMYVTGADEVVSDDEEPEDVDLMLEMAEEEEDVVGFSTVPTAKRLRWSQLYPGEPAIGCAPCRHEGAWYLPLRLRALTVAELRLRREEEKRVQRLAALEDKSTLQQRSVISRLALLATQLRAEAHTRRAGAKVVKVCVFDGDGPGRVDKASGQRRKPWLTFDYSPDTPAEAAQGGGSWSVKVLAPLARQFAKANAVAGRRVGDVSLHCPFSLMRVVDTRHLEALVDAHGCVDLILHGPKKPAHTTLQESDEGSLAREFAQLRLPTDAAAAVAHASSSAHWCTAEKAAVVRTCRVCGELFQAVSGAAPSNVSEAAWRALTHVGCAKYDLVHPPDSAVFLPVTTSLGHARTVREQREQVREAESQQAKSAQIQGLAASLVRAYGDYAQHASTQAESDDEDSDEEEALEGDVWEGACDGDVDAEYSTEELRLLTHGMHSPHAARMVCCQRELRRQLLATSHESTRINGNMDALAAWLVKARQHGHDDREDPQTGAPLNTLRGWRLLPLVEVPQTPKQAAEIAMILKQRERASTLVLRVFDDRPSGRKRGCGDTPLFTVTVRMCASMGMDLVKYRVLRAWENEEGRERTMDWRKDVMLRHPVTGQQFIAVTGGELRDRELDLLRLSVPCARTYAHVHAADPDTLPAGAAGVTTIAGLSASTQAHAHLLRTRMAWRFTPMADVYGPGTCLADWADSKGRVDVLLTLNSALFTAGMTPTAPPNFLARMCAPGYRYFSNTGVAGETVPVRPCNELPSATNVLSLFSTARSILTHFSPTLAATPAQLLAPNFVTAPLKRSDKHAHLHAWPLEQLHAARVCARCDQIFCYAMYLDGKESAAAMCEYHTRAGTQGGDGLYTFPCCGAKSGTCVALAGGGVCAREGEGEAVEVAAAWRGDAPCQRTQHEGTLMFPLRYFLPRLQ